MGKGEKKERKGREGREGRKESGELEVLSSDASDSTETGLATVGQCVSSLVFGKMNYGHSLKMDSLCIKEFHEIGERGPSERSFQRKKQCEGDAKSYKMLPLPPKEI